MKTPKQNNHNNNKYHISNKKSMNKKTTQIGNIKTILRIIFFLLLPLYYFRLTLIYQPILDIFSTKFTTGRIIDEKNFMRRGHLTGRFTYSYTFRIQDKVYKNNSYDEKYQINDTLIIEYNEYFPFINRIKGNGW